MIGYSLEQLSALRKSSLCMCCIDGVPLKDGVHNLFRIEDVPCNEHVNYENEDVSVTERCGVTGYQCAPVDPTK